ncbi:MAG: DUF2442 domain-containing protein [Pyrinomonadaceae bacterium]|nr:DUF2442 domain-containing protein [Acidobacteriota bacterium]
MKKVVSATASDNHTLILRFNDDSVRRFDVKPYLDKGIFNQLKDLDYFKDFKIVFGTVQWKNEQDFAPETLYFESVEIVTEDLAKV